MNCSSARTILLFLVALSACRREQPSPAQTSQPDTTGATLAVSATGDSAATFAWAFYDWYVRHGTRSDSAIVARAALFAPQLLAALKTDFDAQAKDSQEVVGLDWDPFLNTQDPCALYRVGSSTRRANRALVPVFGNCGDTARPHVVAELERNGPSWLFVDFRHTADSGSLLHDLVELSKGRNEGRTGAVRQAAPR